jgi:Mn-dependent DtxR family transcriptional regulator
MTVNRNPGVRPLEAAEIMLLDPSTVTRLVEKLQSKGLVTHKNSGTYLSGSITAPSASMSTHANNG